MAGDSGALPTFIIIGAMKAGTSSFHFHLDKHPEIQTSKPKELHFFVANEDQPPEDFDPRRAFSRGIDWYRGHFDPTVPARGEASTGYLDPRHPGVAKRIAASVPDATIIVLTRDPFDRAVSHYRHMVARGAEDRPLDAALTDPNSIYVALSRYHACLSPFYEHFGSDQIVRFHHADLRDRPEVVMTSAFRLLGVDDSVTIDDLDTIINSGDARGLLHRAIVTARKYPTLEAIAKLVPSGVRSRLDLHRARSKSAAPALESADLSAAFAQLLADDQRSLADDFAMGRISEGIDGAQ